MVVLTIGISKKSQFYKDLCKILSDNLDKYKIITLKNESEIVRIKSKKQETIFIFDSRMYNSEYEIEYIISNFIYLVQNTYNYSSCIFFLLNEDDYVNKSVKMSISFGNKVYFSNRISFFDLFEKNITNKKSSTFKSNLLHASMQNHIEQEYNYQCE